MRCPTCQQATETEQRWCARCGAPLMFLDERAPAPLDRPLDLDRRWRGRTDPAAPGSPAAAPVGREGDDPAVRAPPPWWRSAAGTDGPMTDGAGTPAPITVELELEPTPAADVGPVPSSERAPRPAPEQIPLPALDARPRAAAPRRLLAAAIDAALVTTIGALPVLLTIHPAPAPRAGAAFAACAGFLALLGFTYATLGHALMGATIGKRLLGLRVEGPDGAAPGLTRSVARSALAMAGVAALGAGVVIGLLSRRGQALHDLLVGTSVVRAPAARG